MLAFYISGWCVDVTLLCFFFFNDTATTEIYTLSLHDALPIRAACEATEFARLPVDAQAMRSKPSSRAARSEEHTSELQSRRDLVCRLLLEKKKKKTTKKKQKKIKRKDK